MPTTLSCAKEQAKEGATMTYLEERRNDLQRITTDQNLHGIERDFDRLIYYSKIIVPFELFQLIRGRRELSERFTDWYVLLVTAFLFFLLWLAGPVSLGDLRGATRRELPKLLPHGRAD